MQTQMMQYLLLLVFCGVNFSAIYKKQQNVPKGEVVYIGDEPSKLSCIQKSFFYKADAVYDGRRCTCVKKVVDGDNDLEIGTEGSAYSLVGDINQKKFKNPEIGPRKLVEYESCKEIPSREPSASSGLYTIRYSASKKIQVYCDIDRNQKVFHQKEGEEPEIRKLGTGWMLVANVSFTRRVSKDEAYQITKKVSRNIDELKNAATTNFLFDLSQLLQFPIKFTKIRIYCKRKRTIHFLGMQDVVDYFISKTDTRPASCNTFRRMTDDNSYLGEQCNNWKDRKWGYIYSSVADRMYNFPFYRLERYSYAIYQDRIECDDRLKLGAGTWQIFVR